MSFLATIKRLLGFGPKEVKLGEGDRLLPCDDCKQDFVFDAGEQRFFKEKGFTDPKRCPKCRKKVRSRMRRRGRRGGGGGEDAGETEARPRQSGGGRGESGGKEGGGNEGGRNEGGRGHNGGGRGGHNRGRRHSVIDGDSPYADER